jgi:hypothetical protein
MAFSVNSKFLIHLLSFEKKKLAAQFYFRFRTDSFRAFRAFRAAFAFFFAIIRLKNIQTTSWLNSCRKRQTFWDYQATNIQTVSSGQLKIHVGGMRTCPPWGSSNHRGKRQKKSHTQRSDGHYPWLKCLSITSLTKVPVHHFLD